MAEMNKKSKATYQCIQICKGYDVTPQQFSSLCNDEDMALISKGKLTIQSLRPYARSFAQGIRDKRIRFDEGKLIRHG